MGGLKFLRYFYGSPQNNLAKIIKNAMRYLRLIQNAVCRLWAHGIWAHKIESAIKSNTIFKNVLICFRMQKQHDIIP